MKINKDSHHDSCLFLLSLEIEIVNKDYLGLTSGESFIKSFSVCP